MLNIEKLLEEKHYKAINFDLDKQALESISPGKSKTAYTEIKKFMENNGFSHRQYSGYISNKEISNIELFDVLEKMLDVLPWLNDPQVIQKFDATNIGEEWDLREYLKNPKMDRTLALQQGLVDRTKTNESKDKPATRLELIKNIMQQHSDQGEPIKQQQKSTKKDDIDL